MAATLPILLAFAAVVLLLTCANGYRQDAGPDTPRQYCA
jgi:hypothetical protein